jgi:membrane protease YdiL (CAAX protease family)
LKFPSIKQVNRLYLITLLLVLGFGSLMQIVSFSWGLLGTELLLILLPVIWFHRKNKVSLTKNARLYKPGSALSLVALMLGGGAWLIGSMLEIFIIHLTRYTVPAPEGVLPTHWFQALVIFAAFAIAAPICEEILFRGTIQRAYHNEKKPLTAILIVSFMFVVFHLRFQGFLALIPIALLLGYTYWRTQSLAAAMLVHVANNTLASIVIIQAGLFPAFTLPFPSMPAAAFGILLVVAGLFLLTRLTPYPEPDRETLTPPSHGWSAYWPLLAALVVFSVMAVVEVVTGKSISELKLNAALMPQQTTTYIYQVRHKGDQPVGEMLCTLQPLSPSIMLACARTIEAFAYQSGNSFYSSVDMETTLSVVWNKEDLALQQMTKTNSVDLYNSQWQLTKTEAGLAYTMEEKGTLVKETFPLQTLVEEEWPWRLMGLSFSDTLTTRFNYLEPLAWRQKTQDNGPLLSPGAYLTVSPAEEVSTPAGTFNAWKVSLSNNQTAWYDVNTPHTLVKVEASMFDYYLTSAPK